MAQQWRIRCYNCGSDTSEYLRMHSQLTGEDKHRAIDESGVDEAEASIVVECNNCDNVQVLNGNEHVINKGATPLLDA